MSRALRSFVQLIAALVVLAAVILCVKGVALWNLRRDLDARTQKIAAFYHETINTQVASVSGALLTQDQKNIIASFALLPLPDPLAGRASTQAIIAAQRGFTRLADSAQGTALSSAPEFRTLREDLRKGGKVQPLLDAYNTRAQEWNNQQDDPLGRILWKVFRLEPRLLLQADGKTEYQTTVTF